MAGPKTAPEALAQSASLGEAKMGYPRPVSPTESPSQPWLDAGLGARLLEVLVPESHPQKRHSWRVGPGTQVSEAAQQC